MLTSAMHHNVIGVLTYTYKILGFIILQSGRMLHKPISGIYGSFTTPKKGERKRRGRGREETEERERERYKRDDKEH